jgi:hypothetical protein
VKKRSCWDVVLFLRSTAATSAWQQGANTMMQAFADSAHRMASSIAVSQACRAVTKEGHGTKAEIRLSRCAVRGPDIELHLPRKRRVVSAFRTTIGLPGRLSVRLQPNHGTTIHAASSPPRSTD